MRQKISRISVGKIVPPYGYEVVGLGTSFSRDQSDIEDRSGPYHRGCHKFPSNFQKAISAAAQTRRSPVQHRPSVAGLRTPYL